MGQSMYELRASDIVAMTISRYGTVYACVPCIIPHGAYGYSIENLPISPHISMEHRLSILGVLEGDAIFIDPEKRWVIGAQPSISQITPRTCHACRSPLITFGNHLQCPNETCSGRLLSRIQYFVSPEGIGIAELASIPDYIWKMLINDGTVSSVASLLSPYFHTDLAHVAQLDDNRKASINKQLEFLRHMLYTYSTAATHGVFISTLLRALSIPGMTDRLISCIVSSAMLMTPNENPLIYVAGCLQQPELLLRTGAHTDDVSYLVRNTSTYYQNEITEITNTIYNLA